jgi:hypothetical protein
MVLVRLSQKGVKKCATYVIKLALFFLLMGEVTFRAAVKYPVTVLILPQEIDEHIPFSEEINILTSCF